MWNEPTLEELSKLPGLYETEKTAMKDKIIHMHFFLGPCDWYAAEYSSKEGLFFGYANLGDPVNAEWGYFSLYELRNVRTPEGFQIDRDLHWNPRRVEEIPELSRAYRKFKD